MPLHLNARLATCAEKFANFLHPHALFKITACDVEMKFSRAWTRKMLAAPTARVVNVNLLYNRGGNISRNRLKKTILFNSLDSSFALVCTLLCFVHSFWGSNICCQTQWIVAIYPRDFASSLKLALARVETSSPTRRQMHLSNAQNAFVRGRPKDVRTLNLMTVTLTSCRPGHKFRTIFW